MKLIDVSSCYCNFWTDIKQMIFYFNYPTSFQFLEKYINYVIFIGYCLFLYITSFIDNYFDTWHNKWQFISWYVTTLIEVLFVTTYHEFEPWKSKNKLLNWSTQRLTLHKNCLCFIDNLVRTHTIYKTIQSKLTGKLYNEAVHERIPSEILRTHLRVG